jgi:hypothetical protein
MNISDDCYNALIAALMENKTSGSDIANERADALLAKICKYARFYSDDEGEYAEIRFFESEARNLIWLMVRAYALHSSDDEGYYHIAKEGVHNGDVV